MSLNFMTDLATCTNVFIHLSLALRFGFLSGLAFCVVILCGCNRSNTSNNSSLKKYNGILCQLLAAVNKWPLSRNSTLF